MYDHQRNTGKQRYFKENRKRDRRADADTRADCDGRFRRLAGTLIVCMLLHAWIDSWLAPEFASWNLDAELRQVRSPILSLHGDTDEYGSTTHPERIARLAPADTTVHILPSCGHVPHREQEDVVLGYVRAWQDTAKP